MKVRLCPSMMCADIFDLKNTIDVFEKYNIDCLHIDIMDGVFVPNYTLGTDYCRQLKKKTHIPLDYHLMIDRPEDKIDRFPIEKGDYVSIHYESTNHPQRVLGKLREKGAKPIIALNPATPVSCIEYLLDDIDAVLIMTVNPGYSGQKLIPSTLNKIKETREFLDSKGYENVEIEVDGNVSFENAVKMREMGADMFVAGSSSIFSESFSLGEGIEKFLNTVK